MEMQYPMLQPDNINLSVLFWYFVKKSDASEPNCTVAYTGEVTYYIVPQQDGHVYLVTLYFKAV